MKYGKLLQVHLEQMPVEYRDKFLSYKQLKKVINTILQDNSLATAAFVEVPVQEVVRGEDAENGERAFVEAISARDVEVARPVAEGVEPAVKRARGDKGVSVATGVGVEEGRGGDGGGVAVVAGTKRKVGEVEAEVEAGCDAGVNVATAPIQREVLAARQVAVCARGGDEKELTKEEENFLNLLNKELEKFNSFFTEKEEEYVIRLQELKNELERVRQQDDADVHPSVRRDDLMSIRIDLVTFHGEVILMESYSTLNYTGLVKILKKHDKRTGAVLRLPFIRRVLLQPFFSTELLSQLVKECNALLSTFPPPRRESIDGAGDAQSEPRERPYMTGPAAEGIFKSTMAALRTIQEMRKGSSTVSAQSLPPCNLNGNDERYVVLNENSWSIRLPDHSRKQESESMACAS